MTTHRRRRGQSWQDCEWRRVIASEGDYLGDRARAAFAKLRQQTTTKVDDHSFARTPAPYTGDAVAAAGEFVVKPEYRGFA